MLHIDLFSGIGGFALAVDTVWGKENVKHILVDNDLFCQKVLRKHWPNSKLYGDIRTFTYADFRRQAKQEQQTAGDKQCDRESITTNAKSRQSREQTKQKGREDIGRGSILTGGFPCQPFSQAGVRRGTADDRYLWPEMLRVISEFKPEWVIAENVSGLLSISDGMVFESVCTDLEKESYEVQPFIIPAVAVGAPHRRDRVWIVGHFKNPRSKRGSRRSKSSGQILECQSSETEIARPDSQSGTTDTEREGHKRQEHKKGQSAGHSGRTQWDKHWFEVATQFCSVDDGLSVELGEFKLSKARHRAEQLKAYGNAIVPAVAVQILQGIKLVEQEWRRYNFQIILEQ